jgi:hypothetical protein
MAPVCGPFGQALHILNTNNLYA